MARGCFAEVQKQEKVPGRKAEAHQRALAEDRDAAVRRREQAPRARQGTGGTPGRASEAERKKFALEAKAGVMQTRVEKRNAVIPVPSEDIGRLLTCILDSGNRVGLETLRRPVERRLLDRACLEKTLRAPSPRSETYEPQLAVDRVQEVARLRTPNAPSRS